MIGGTDVTLWVRDDVSASDVILRTVRRHWPAYVFQDADDPEPRPPDAQGWLPEPTGREFFIYADARIAASWLDQGTTPENENAMLHVILGDRRLPGANLRSLTLVCGELVGETRAIIDEIDASFRDSAESLRRLPEAA